MIQLTTVAAEAATAEMMSSIEVSGAVQEGINVFELAMKGGWIMIILAVLSILGIYIFFERLAVLRKAMKRNPLLLDRLHDNIMENDPKSAINYC